MSVGRGHHQPYRDSAGSPVRRKVASTIEHSTVYGTEMVPYSAPTVQPTAVYAANCVEFKRTGLLVLQDRHGVAAFFEGSSGDADPVGRFQLAPDSSGRNGTGKQRAIQTDDRADFGR